MAEGEMPAPIGMEQGETLSMSLLGGKDVKPGDIVRIKVQSLNDEDGTWSGVYADDEGMESGMAAPGINNMAAAFDEVKGEV